MLSGVFLFEVRAHSGKLTFLTAAGFFGFLGFVTAASGFGPDDVDLNGPWAVANAMGLLSLGTVFSLTLFCAQSVLRDDEHQMTEIICSTAVTRRDLLLGRFLGSFAAAVLAFAAAPFGMALGSLVAGDAERVVPFALVNYAWPFLVLALPSLLSSLRLPPSREARSRRTSPGSRPTCCISRGRSPPIRRSWRARRPRPTASSALPCWTLSASRRSSRRRSSSRRLSAT